MPLPIPEILQNAAAVINAAKVFSENDTNIPRIDLKDALDKVNSNDLMAVLNEVGLVYTAAANPQIIGMGCGANLIDKTVDLGIKIITGFGPREVVLKMNPDQAEAMIAQLRKDLDQLRPSGLIVN